MEDIGVENGELCVKVFIIMAILILRVEGCTVNRWNTDEVYRQIQNVYAIQQCCLFRFNRNIVGYLYPSSLKKIIPSKHPCCTGNSVMQRYFRVAQALPCCTGTSLMHRYFCVAQVLPCCAGTSVLHRYFRFAQVLPTFIGFRICSSFSLSPFYQKIIFSRTYNWSECV
jgi:hypothetical protein